MFEAGIKDLGGFDHLDPALASKAKGQVCMCVYVCVRVCFMCTQALFVCMNHTYTTLSLSLSLSLSLTHTHTHTGTHNRRTAAPRANYPAVCGDRVAG